MKHKLILIMLSALFLLTSCNKNSTESIKLNSQINAKTQEIQQLQSKINQLEKDKKLLTDKENERNKFQADITKKGEELMKNLKNMNSLSQVVDAYYFQLDGAFSEGYSDTLYEFYKKEGIEKLIELLEKKDTSTIEGISHMLISEYTFDKDVQSVNVTIEKLNSINTANLTDKKKYIVLQLLSQCYLLKANINLNK